jgi:excisionase family DNA binding protein
MTKRFYTPQEAADLLQVSSTTVMNLIHSGRLPATKVSERIYRISVPAFERFASGRPPTEFQVRFKRVRRVGPIGEPIKVPTESELADA